MTGVCKCSAQGTLPRVCLAPVSAGAGLALASSSATPGAKTAATRGSTAAAASGSFAASAVPLVTLSAEKKVGRAGALERILRIGRQAYSSS